MRMLFIVGFGPILDYLLPTKKLYSGDLEIEFHEYEGGYMHAQKLMAAKGLSCTGPLIHWTKLANVSINIIEPLWKGGLGRNHA